MPRLTLLEEYHVVESAWEREKARRDRAITEGRSAERQAERCRLLYRELARLDDLLATA
jgi:hypothetical protein